MSNHINFIEKEKLKFEFNYLIIISAFAVLVISSLSFGIIQKLRLGNIQEELIKKEKQLVTLTTTAKTRSVPLVKTKAKDFDNFIKKYEKRIDLSVLIRLIKAKLSSSIFFTEIILKMEEKEAEITGSSYSHRNVIRFVNHLKESKFFSKVNLQELQAEMIEQKKGVRFKIVGTIS